MIRRASVGDVEQMVGLAESKRAEYEQYAPTFWRRAKDAAERQTPFFYALIHRQDTICLVSEDEGRVHGFIIASVVPAPPVYDPGGPVCMVDDFVVENPAQWPTTGATLLQEVRRLAQEQGAGLAVVVCGHLDEAKRAMLRLEGFSIASEWYVRS